MTAAQVGTDVGLSRAVGRQHGLYQQPAPRIGHQTVEQGERPQRGQQVVQAGKVNQVGMEIADLSVDGGQVLQTDAGVVQHRQFLADGLADGQRT